MSGPGGDFGDREGLITSRRAFNWGETRCPRKLFKNCTKLGGGGEEARW